MPICQYFRQNSKRTIVFLTEIAAVFFMAIGVLPREASLFLTGLLVFYFLFSPLKDSLWVFIASIPLFIALPITENFDSMANWRILLLVLFLVLLFKNKWRIKMKFLQFEYLTGIFFFICLASLAIAPYFFVGLKKILFLLNLSLLYIIIRNLKNTADTVKSALKTAIGLTLAIGYIQLISVFIIPLHTFWQFWTKNVISVFYGSNLSNLLSYSNAWFSYYTYLPPTLRMFSVFPDSHSFAFFCILSLPIILSAIFFSKKKYNIALYIPLILCLLGILFSGSRGAWISALGVLILFALYSIWKIKEKSIFKKNILYLVLGSLVIFFLLIPVSSGILFLSQKAQVKDLDIEKLSIFERAKSITDLSELSVKSRLQIWETTLNSIAEKPFRGVGFGNYPLIIWEDISSAKRGASAHNLYLDIAAETGMFALITLLVIFWQIFKISWKKFQNNKTNKNRQAWSGFFILAFVWILGYSLFDVVLLNDKVFLFFMAILGVTINNKHDRIN